MKPLKSKLVRGVSLALLVGVLASGCQSKIVTPKVKFTNQTMPVGQVDPRCIIEDDNYITPILCNLIREMEPTTSEYVNTLDHGRGYMFHDIYEFETEEFHARLEHWHGESQFTQPDNNKKVECEFEMTLKREEFPFFYQDYNCNGLLESESFSFEDEIKIDPDGWRGHPLKWFKEEARPLLVKYYNADLENYIAKLSR